ncbi:GNAT family N-acetyltransferase [Streptomyces sp. WG-D5]
MEELVRLGEVERAACGEGLARWAAQGRDGDRLGPGVRAWCHGTALVVASPNARQNRLAVAGDAADCATLVPRALAEVGPSYRLLGTAELIDELVRRLPALAALHRFFWMETTSPSGADAEGVRWLDAREEKEAASLFDRFFPDSYAQPGQQGVRRWAGILGTADGEAHEPLAVAADAWSATGCGFMGGVLTHPAARGRGLARAVSGFVVDALVHEHGRAALMVMTGNTPAITTYERLGMTKQLYGAAQRAAE